MKQKGIIKDDITHRTFENFIISELNPTELLIIKFVHRWDKKIPPNTGDISKVLKLPQSTISSSLKRMKEESKKKKRGLLFEWEPYHGIALTSYGNEIAEHIEEHHHIFELFLHKSLGLTEEISHKESDLIGLNVSCDLANAILEKFQILNENLGQCCICPEEKGTVCVLK